MCQKLPTEIIQSRPVDEGESEKILNEALSLSEDSNHGMLLEVDIEYPKNLHKDHNALSTSSSEDEVKRWREASTDAL